MREFHCYMIRDQRYKDEQSKMWGHPTDDSKLRIIKDGTTIILEPEEIKKLVRCVNATFNR